MTPAFDPSLAQRVETCGIVVAVLVVDRVGRRGPAGPEPCWPVEWM